MHIVLNFFTQLGYRGVAYQKQLSGPKLMGVWATGACKIWDPLFIFANLGTVTTMREGMLGYLVLR